MIRPRGMRSIEPSFYRKEWQETGENLHEVFVLDELDHAKQELPYVDCLQRLSNADGYIL